MDPDQDMNNARVANELVIDVLQRINGSVADWFKPPPEASSKAWAEKATSLVGHQYSNCLLLTINGFLGCCDDKSRCHGVILKRHLTSMNKIMTTKNVVSRTSNPSEDLYVMSALLNEVLASDNKSLVHEYSSNFALDEGGRTSILATLHQWQQRDIGRVILRTNGLEHFVVVRLYWMTLARKVGLWSRPTPSNQNNTHLKGVKAARNDTDITSYGKLWKTQT